MAASTSPAATSAGTTRAMSSSTGGNGEISGAGAGGGGWNAPRSSSIAQVRSGSPRVVTTRGCKLAGVADDAVVQHELGASPGMPWRLVAAANGQLGSGSPGQDAGGLDRVGPVGQASGPPPARAIARSGQHDGSVPGLIRQGRFERRQLRIRRPVRDARPRHGVERPGAGGIPVRSRTGTAHEDRGRDFE